MGKGRIVSHDGEGRYTVEILHDRERVDAELAQLETDIETWTEQLADAQEALDEAEQAHDDAQQALNDAINQRDEEGQIDRVLVTRRTREAMEAALVVRVADIRTKEIDSNIQQAQARKAELEALPFEPSLSAWCADYSTELSGEVGTIEVPGEPDQVLIRPGHDDDATWTEPRDGQLVQRVGMASYHLYWCAAVLPGWQRWRPTYRLGEITSLGEGVANVLLDAETSSADGLPIDPPGGRSLSGVPIQYMDCDEAAFEEGDRVLVEYAFQDAEQPRIIGFESDPRPCGVPCHGLVINGQLTLANGEVISYPYPVNRNADLITCHVGYTVSPLCAPRAAQSPRGYEIRNNRRIAGVITPENSILYCDENGVTWVIEYRNTLVNDVLQVRLHVIGRFSYFAAGGQAQFQNEGDVLLYSADLSPSDNQPSPDHAFYSWGTHQRPDGKKSLLKIFRTFEGMNAAQEFGVSFFGSTENIAGRRLSDLYEVSISGAGSTEQGYIGQGITASVALLSNFSGLGVDNRSLTNSFPSGGWLNNFPIADCAQFVPGGPIGADRQVFLSNGSGDAPPDGWGKSVNGTLSTSVEIDVAVDAYYAAGQVAFTRKEYSNQFSFSIGAQIGASEDYDYFDEGSGIGEVTYCKSLSGSGSRVSSLSMSVSVAGETTEGASWNQTTTGTGPGTVCVTLPFSDNDTSVFGDTFCSADFGDGQAGSQQGFIKSTTSSGEITDAEVYVSVLAGNGLTLMAAGTTAGGQAQYSRTVIAPDGNSLAIDPVAGPITYQKMHPLGVAWNPGTGEIVYHPGSVVGFV